MSGNLTRVDCRDTRVSVRFGMYGVPDIPRTRFTFDVASLETNEADVAFILGDIAGRTLQPTDAERLRRMGRISFTDVSTACSAILRHRGGSAWIREMST